MVLDYPEPTLYAIPYFVASMFIEARALREGRAPGRDWIGYETKDTRASLAMGVGSLVTVTVINMGVFLLATWLWAYRITDLGRDAVAWGVAIVGWDVGYYWHHRLEHECRLFWASHVSHHSSQRYNLSTALRQPLTPFTSMLFFPPLAVLGVAPWMIMVAGGINLIYQFWVHTECIVRMPRWFEHIFNTPSHHRVHHGSNAEYLDKNYAGILILWDRLFGTFEPERARVAFGLTKNIATYNPLIIGFHEYAAIARDVVAAPRWRDRLGILWHGPGWRP